MKCYYHNDLDSVGVCTNCGKALCAECKTLSGDKIVCKACAQNPVLKKYDDTESYANPFARLAAFIIDTIVWSVIVFTVFFVTIIPTGLIGSLFPEDSPVYGLIATFWLLAIVVFTVVFTAVYFIWTESSKYMGTPGKMLLGIQVVDENYNRISLLKSTARFILKIICINITITLILLVILMLTNKQAIYDSFLKIKVLKKSAYQSIQAQRNPAVV